MAADAELARRGVDAIDPPSPTGLECLVLVARQHGLHLTSAQLIQDNMLGSGEVSASEIVKCAGQSGMRAKVVNLDWDSLTELRKALPAIVCLKDGSKMVLIRLEGDKNNPRVVLRDPKVGEDALLIIDRIRLDDVWTGEVILVKRDYALSDETQPFSFGFITALIFRERRIVRDVTVAALIIGLLALGPILFFRLLQEKVIYYKAFNTFWVLCLAMAVIILFETIFFFLRQYLIQNLTARVDVKLSTYVFDKILNLPIDFFERNAVGLVARDMREVFKVRNFLVGQVFGTILDSTTLIFFVPVMFFFSPLMTFIVLGFSGLTVAWLILMLPWYRKKSAGVIAAEGAQGAFMVQNLAGIRTVKSLALEARQRHMWDVHVARVAKARLAEGLAGVAIQALVKPLERLTVTAPYAVGVYLALTTTDPMYIGALFAFILLSQRVAAPLMHIAQLVNQLDEARTAVAIVGNLTNQEPEEGRSGHGVRTALHGHVEFDHVIFKYKGAVSPALNDVSFEIPNGTRLGVMGKSGSGKTTITRLLQRLHSNYAGLIKIDGVDVREYDVDHLRRSIGVVLQENFLFSGTIRENIAAAKPDATFDEVVRAARLAGAEEFIDKLPRGYETYIYEGSPNLSGGQRQRIAIARALIIDPPILVLDEATSALDAESEAIVNANISRIAHGRTLIIVSHRLSSLVNCDAILVLDSGSVNDIGRHEELLARNDIYGSLWHEQNSHVMPARRPRANLGGPTLVS